jgi:hypothetical protein
MLGLWRTNLHSDMFLFPTSQIYLRQCNIMNVPYSCNLLSDAPLGPCNRKGGGAGIIPLPPTPFCSGRVAEKCYSDGLQRKISR